MLRFLLGSNSVGFLTLHNIEGTGHLGSLLITDFKGIPLEFRCTHPIKPDEVQISLYGEAFFSHVGVEILGKPLIRSIENKPKVIFVDKPFLLGLDDHSKCPVIFVKIIDVDEDANVNDYLHKDYKIEVIKPGGDAKPLEIVKKNEINFKLKELVERLHSEFDILELFERMRKAMETIVRKNSNPKKDEDEKS